MNELILTYDEWLDAAIAHELAAKANETYHYSIGFPSGAVLQCDGDTIVGRVELIPLPVKTLADLFRKPQYTTTPADPSAQRDAQHKPLPVQGRTPFDSFKDCDFTVTRSNNDGIGFAGKSAHPLQRFTSADCK